MRFEGKTCILTGCGGEMAKEMAGRILQEGETVSEHQGDYTKDFLGD